MVAVITKQKILRSIKKFLKEQEGGYGRYTKMLDFVVKEKGITSEKWFKICLKELVDAGKLDKKDRDESFRLVGKRWSLYCMPDWAKKEGAVKADIDELVKSRRAMVAKIKTKVGKTNDEDLPVIMYHEYSRLNDLYGRLRIRQEFTGDRASPEYEKLVKKTIPKMIADLFAIFKNISKKQKNKLVDDLLSLMEDEPIPFPFSDPSAIPENYGSEGEPVYPGGTWKHKLLPNIR